MGEKSYFLNESVDNFIRSRNIPLVGEVNGQMALNTMMMLLQMNEESREKPITLYIDSGGGSVPAGWTIIDTMNAISAPVDTICYGTAASMAAIILAAGRKRYALPHSLIMIHQPSLVTAEESVRQEDFQVLADRIKSTREGAERFLAERSNGKADQARFHEACRLDTYLSPEEALELGIIDEILGGEKRL